MPPDPTYYATNPNELTQATADQLLEDTKTWLSAVPNDPVETTRILVAYRREVDSLYRLIRPQRGNRHADRGIAASIAEILRRTERAIGLTIRAGQQQGDIRAHSDRTPRAELGRKPGPGDFLPKYDLSRVDGGGVYDFTDGVSDGQFEAAIAAARAEGDLSRVNIGRKLKNKEAAAPAKAAPQPPKYGTRRKHLQTFQALTERLGGVQDIVDNIHELDASITPQEAAPLARLLADQTQSLIRIHRLLKDRSR